jgi:hypothetical protein
LKVGDTRLAVGLPFERERELAVAKVGAIIFPGHMTRGENVVELGSSLTAGQVDR